MRKAVIPVLGMCMACLVGLGLPAATALAASPPADEKKALGLYFGEEELVEVATRVPKPISQVAENVTIITAEEIEAMNAHTVAEVLNRVAGVFISFDGKDFANVGFATIHASDYEHVLILLDGIRWNNAGTDSNFTNQIPVQIIKRIEVIKGAASSAWGSALGGVVNIITKDAGKNPTPTLFLSGSRGEYNSQDYRADISGAAGRLGYYLFGGHQESDGIVADRFFDNDSFYGKLRLDAGRKVTLGFTMGRTVPEYQYLNSADVDLFDVNSDRISFYTAEVSMVFSPGLTANISAHSQKDTISDTGGMVSIGIPDYFARFGSRTKGIRSRLAYNQGRHAAVLGAEIERRKFTDDTVLVSVFESHTSGAEEIWALFANDTVSLGKTSVTPGIRYDHLSTANPIVSPSLGVTYQFLDTTLLRGLISRGFRKPTLSLLQANPGLEKDKTWTYQAGLETTALTFARLKATFFLHETDQYWDKVNYLWVNGQTYRRKGMELEVQTLPLHYFSLTANATYVKHEPANGPEADQYNANVILAYDNPRILQARFMGHYNWYGAIFSPDSWQGDYGRFIWDLALSRRLFTKNHLEGELFCTVRNLFNGSDTVAYYYPHEDRWAEAGFRMRVY